MTLTTGHDTFVVEADPTGRNSRARFLKIRSGDELVPLFYMPVNPTRIANKTIVSAVLSVPVENNWVSQTVTIQALAADWKVARVDYNTVPAVTGPTANSGATGVLAAGDRFEIDVTALIQEIADGEPNYGWKLTTSQSTDASWIRGFDSGYESFTLDIEFVDRPDAPTALAPEGVISVSNPVLMVDDVDDLAEMQVQIDATPSGTSADYDTDWVATTKPKLNMSATFPDGTAAGVADTTYNGLSDGSTTYWRARVKLLNGGISEWSSWAEITRDAKPSLVMDNPSGTDLWDPTPDITAHLSPAGDADTRWQVIIADVGDPSNHRYNSGDDIEGATLDHSIPIRWKGRKVFPTDGQYRLEVRAWDRTDRAASYGDPPFIRSVVIVDLDSDGTVTAPTLSVSMVEGDQGYPTPRLHVERASDPDWFVVRRDGEFLTTFDVDEFRTAPGEWDWDDESALPNTEHTYAVRARTTIAPGDTHTSNNSNTASITTTVHGVWIRSDLGNVELYGDSIDAAQVDKRQSFEMPYRSENVDIVTAIGGIEGTAALTIDRRAEDLDAALDILQRLRDIPHAEVQLVWGAHNVWVHLRGLSVTVSPTALLPDAPVYDVRFGFYEIDPAD